MLNLSANSAKLFLHEPLIGPLRRDQLEAVLCSARKEGKGIAADPGFVSLPVEGGQGVSALASWHVEVAFGFSARCDGKALRWPTEDGLSPGNINVPGKRRGRKVKPASQKRR